MTTIIGLMGPAGAGKSSVAEHLVDKYGARRYSFAEPLKTFAMNALGFTHEQCWGTQAQKEAPDERYGGKSARWFLQKLGTEGARKTFGEDFWTKQLLEKINREKPDLAVIDDARFVNEARAICTFNTSADPRATEYGRHGFVWRLDSPNRETAADATHASEREWLDAPTDYVIAPERRGLDLLFSLVDEAARAFKLMPKRREIAQ